MRRIRSVALVCAGPISRGIVARLPGLVDHIGWVKAPSYRLASRAVNALRAGIPVQEYEEMNSAGLFVVNVPRELEDSTFAELATARIDWRNRAVIVLDTLKDSHSFDALRKVGALLATVHPIGANEERILFIEGEQDVIRRMQKVLSPRVARTIQVITTTGKARLLEGIDEATRGFFPVIASVTDHFKAAGLSKAQSDVIAQGLMTNSMRSYFRAGRRVLVTRNGDE